MQPYTREQNIVLVTWERVLNNQRYQILHNATKGYRKKHCSGYIGHVPKKQHTPYTREQKIALVTVEHVLNKLRYQMLLNATIH